VQTWRANIHQGVTAAYERVSTDARRLVAAFARLLSGRQEANANLTADGREFGEAQNFTEFSIDTQNLGA
jgi:hypothetical protein